MTKKGAETYLTKKGPKNEKRENAQKAGAVIAPFFQRKISSEFLSQKTALFIYFEKDLAYAEVLI